MLDLVRVPYLRSDLLSNNSTEYKKSKKSDVIASLISLFESRDVFVKEFQRILGERLLKKEHDFDKEASFLVNTSATLRLTHLI